MKHDTDAKKLIECLKEHPQGLTKHELIRKCNLGSERTFFAVIAYARITEKIPKPVNKRYIIHTSSDIDSENSVQPFVDDQELIALLSIRHILSGISSGLLKNFFDPLEKRFDKFINKLVKDPASWAERIRMLDIHYRCIEPGVFSFLTMAIARKRAVRFSYTDSGGKESLRVVSPQQLVRYKDNWYCDGWCHDAGELRIFSLDTIKNQHFKNTPYREIAPAELKRVYGTSYGIFSGQPTETAHLRFRGKAARYATREQWHPRQILTVCTDATVELRIPYNNPAELIRMILYWGDEVEVVGPQGLQNEVAGLAKRIVGLYTQ